MREPQPLEPHYLRVGPRLVGKVGKPLDPSVAIKPVVYFVDGRNGVAEKIVHLHMKPER